MAKFSMPRADGTVLQAGQCKHTDPVHRIHGLLLGRRKAGRSLSISLRLAYHAGMRIRKAVETDFPVMLSLYDEARTFMHSHGNPHQWIGGYPSEPLLRDDLAKGRLYVVVADSGEVVGVFVFFVGIEPTYGRIVAGTWPDDKPYGVVHRIASRQGSHGVGTYALEWAWRKSGRHLRIDTHKDNLPMRRLVAKLDFQYCGIVFMEDGSERIAFQKNGI